MPSSSTKTNNRGVRPPGTAIYESPRPPARAAWLVQGGATEAGGKSTTNTWNRNAREEQEPNEQIRARLPVAAMPILFSNASADDPIAERVFGVPAAILGLDLDGGVARWLYSPAGDLDPGSRLAFGLCLPRGVLTEHA